MSYGKAKVAACAGLASLLAVWAVAPARSEGAVAVGQPRDVAASGYAIGLSGNYQTETEAKARALKECRAGDAAPESTRNLCKVVRTFKKGCVAAALDPKDGTPGAGWALAANRPDAEKAAVAACRKTAGKAREEFCVVSAVQCDGVE
ncbi:MAG: DUF4189 domain-containing protein [Hyphomicrobiaceae bacterium]